MSKACLIQIAETKPLKILVSVGNLGLKNSEGPWAAPRDCFFKERPSKKLKVRTKNPEEHISAATTYLKQIGIKGEFDIGYDPENSIETEEPGHTEVFMGTGAYASSPGVLYTQGLATCLGMGFYSPSRKEGSLFHIAGSGGSSVKMLESVVRTETERLGKGLIAHFASGLATTDEDALNDIQNARKRAEEIFSGYRFQRLESTICVNPMEYVLILSLNTKSGTFKSKKATVTPEKLRELENEAYAQLTSSMQR